MFSHNHLHNNGKKLFMKDSNFLIEIVMFSLQITIIHRFKNHSFRNRRFRNCRLGFTKRQNLKKHIETFHEGIKPFKCSICDAEFSNKQNLKKHVSEGLKPFKCSVCDIKFDPFKLRLFYSFRHIFFITRQSNSRGKRSPINA